VSFEGKLLAIETDGFAWDPKTQDYDRSRQRWKISVLRDPGVVGDRLVYAHTGNSHFVEYGRALIGQRVRVLQGGKEGIVVGIEPAGGA